MNTDEHRSVFICGFAFGCGSTALWNSWPGFDSPRISFRSGSRYRNLIQSEASGVGMTRLIRVQCRLLMSTAILLATAPHDSFTAQQASKPAKRHLTIEDYYRIQTVGSPQISPDGRWLAFTVSTRIEEDNSTRTEAY